MIVGKVLRANMRTFIFGTRLPESDVPTFGALVRTRSSNRLAQIFGLIYDIALIDDERGMVKSLSVADNARDEDIEWIRNQMVPLEVSVLCVGYQERDDLPIRQGLPAQPPIALHGIELCESSEVIQFTRQLDFFRVIFDSRDVPCDELLSAMIRQAVRCRPVDEQRYFALECGRELARLLANDSLRLEGLIRKLHAGLGEPSNDR